MDKTRIVLEALITEREGMIAENVRAGHVEIPPYGQEDFASLADQMRSLDEETGIYDSIALEKAKEQEWKREAWWEVISLIKDRQVGIYSIGDLTEFGKGRLYETKGIRTAIEELCSP